MSRRLVAAVACRNQGARLYGKPLQNLDVDRGVRIIDNIIGCLKSLRDVDEIVLGISEGIENEAYRMVAEQHGLSFIVGDQKDVLWRLVQCGDQGHATDIFRITSESPFLYFEPVAQMWQRHQAEHADATFLWDIIDGAGCEIYTMETLRASHARGAAKHRSELCSLYVREHPEEFNVLRIDAPVELRRKDVRLTVDYPEDLVVCRAVYRALRAQAPRLSVPDIVRFLDAHPRLLELLAPYTEAGYATMDLWGAKLAVPPGGSPERA